MILILFLLCYLHHRKKSSTKEIFSNMSASEEEEVRKKLFTYTDRLRKYGSIIGRFSNLLKGGDPKLVEATAKNLQ